MPIQRICEPIRVTLQASLYLRTQIAIRAATRRDLDRILDIEAASFGPDAWDRELFTEALEGCPGLFLLAKLNGRVAGYAVTCIDGDRAELISIAVFPESRHCGVGQAILRHSARKLKQRGVRRWRLMVRVSNPDAIRLYLAFGFRRSRTVKNYYGRRSDAWLMEWRA